MISTRNLSLLPDVVQLRSAFQSMAMLDAIISPEWQDRYYSFDASLPSNTTVSLGWMRNGSGDYFHAIFGKAGCLIQGFAHESDMSPFPADSPKVFPGVLDDVPHCFSGCMAAIHSDWWIMITFCIWREYSDSKWHSGHINFPDHSPDPDGSEHLLSIFDGQPETYLSWAEGFFQKSSGWPM
jgi:hypothetical protein